MTPPGSPRRRHCFGNWWLVRRSSVPRGRGWRSSWPVVAGRSSGRNRSNCSRRPLPERICQATIRELEALLLARRGGKENRQRAREILEKLLAESEKPAAGDRVVVARLYEQDGLVEAADKHLRAIAEADAPVAASSGLLRRVPAASWGCRGCHALGREAQEDDARLPGHAESDCPVVLPAERSVANRVDRRAGRGETDRRDPATHATKPWWHSTWATCIEASSRTMPPSAGISEWSRFPNRMAST